MSFTSDTKQEIAKLELEGCCKKAQISAFVKLCSSLSIESQKQTLLIKVENATIAKRIYRLIKEIYDVEVSISVFRKVNLKKNNIYYLRILNQALFILEDLGLYSKKGLLKVPLVRIVQKECCARSYLAGIFMANGTVNTPTKSNYHLEMKVDSEAMAQFVLKLLRRFYIEGKMIMRRHNYIVYLKAADKIADFLRVIGAFNALIIYEDIRISRDFTNNYLRLNNCEIANEMKSLKAAQEQMRHIECLEAMQHIHSIDSKLKEVIRIRKENPEASLSELVGIYEKTFHTSISKSGLKHRFEKIKALAETYEEVV